MCPRKGEMHVIDSAADGRAIAPQSHLPFLIVYLQNNRRTKLLFYPDYDSDSMRIESALRQNKNTSKKSRTKIKMGLPATGSQRIKTMGFKF